MSALRILGICYLATASLFVLAIVTADQARLHAAIDGASVSVPRRLDEDVSRSFHAFAQIVSARLFDPPQRQAMVELKPLEPGEERTYARAKLPPITARRLIDRMVPQEKIAALPPLLTIAPDLPSFESDVVPPPADQTAAIRQAVLARLEKRLTPELRANFDLFLFVDKAGAGPAGQRLYVFKKGTDAKLSLLYDWAASTGREADEISPQGRRAFTATPAGLYQFDPSRLYRHYFSRAWNGEMPFAMFFDWVRHGAKTGIAVHAATGSGIARLGERTSAGCIHISPAHAARLFKLIRADYKGLVPRFAYDAQDRTSSNKGDLMRDAAGHLVMADGYRVLVDVEDFSGEEALAALL